MSVGPGNSTLADYHVWRERIVRESAFECRPIDFDQSAEWAFEDGILRHRTRGFFSLAGIRAQSRSAVLDGREQLIILQPEIAINGFLVRRGAAGGEVLFQGRVEPGNVGALQLAPTVQSTEANYRRMHGGKATPMVEWFLDASRARTIFDELQSEEGSRYHGKYNQNVVRELAPGERPDAPDNFRWYGIEALRRLSLADNVLNTDARSVLACLDWRYLAEGGRPFGVHAPGSFGASLQRSFEAVEHGCERSVADLFAWLTRLRVRCALRAQVIPISALGNWVIGKDRISERVPELGFCARQFRVVALGREVSSWDQPLIQSSGRGCIALACQERFGVLHFLMKASSEIGFLEGVQLSATIVAPPGSAPSSSDPVEAELLARIESGEGVERMASCRQSEEGGRFYRDENDYSVLRVDPAVALPESDSYRWFSLGQIKHMMAVPGTFSMELRGVLALLLRWL
jgi:oxidase EvaA